MATVAYATAHGLGHHAFTLSDDDMKIYGITVFIQAIFTTVASLCFLKISVAFSLLRLSSPMKKWWTWMLWGLIGTIPNMFSVEEYPTVYASCSPGCIHTRSRRARDP